MNPEDVSMRALVLLLMAALAWSTFAVHQSSMGGFGMDHFLFLAYSGVALTLLSVIFAVHARLRRPRRPFAQVAVVPVILASGFFLGASSLPFRLRFLASRPQLEAEAALLLADPHRVAATPRRIGFLRVTDVVVYPSQVGFITAPSGFDTAGVVFTSLPRPIRHGEDSFTALSGSWWRWHQSW